MLIDENTRMLIQGITGRFGQGVARRMLEVGSKVVAGVTPGRGGQSVWGMPVYDTVQEALEKVASSPNGVGEASLIERGQ